jgi:hypothetical protein
VTSSSPSTITPRIYIEKSELNQMSRLDEQELLNIVADEIGTKDSPLHHLPSDGIHVSYRVRRDKQGGISLSILIVIVYPNILLLSYL